jgi:hypothetical protein
MHTKTTESPRVEQRPSRRSSQPAPSIADTVAYWLEDERRVRITKLYRCADRPLRWAGGALERFGHVAGLALARQDTSGTRHIVVTGAELAELARPFMPQRTPEEAAALAPFFAALRRIAGPRDPDPEITDKRVY